MGFTRSSNSKSFLFVIVTLLLVGAASHAAESKPLRPLRRIAIAPFRNVKKETKAGWLGVGVGKATSLRIQCIPGLLVTNPSELVDHLERAKVANEQMDSVQTARKIGKLARVDRVLVGSYLIDKGNMILDVKVVHADTGEIVASECIELFCLRGYDVPVHLARLVVESYEKTVVVEDGKPRLQATGDERLVLSDEIKQLIQTPDTDQPEAFVAWCAGASLLPSQRDKRVDHLRKAAGLDPNYGLAHCMLALDLPETVNGDTEAAKHMAKAMELLPDSPWPRLIRALKNHNAAEVKQDCQWLLKRDPNDILALTILLGSEDSADAVQYATRALQIDPQCVRAYSLLAYMLNRDGKSSEAIALANRGLAAVAPMDAGILYATRAAVYAASGQADKAAEDINRAIDLDPNDGNLFAMRAIRVTPPGNDDSKMKDLNRAIELGANDPVILTRRGWLHYGAYTNREAVADFSQALRVNPGYCDALVGRGMAFTELGQYDKAVKDFSAVIETDRDGILAYRERAKAYYRQNDLSLAIEDINRAIELSSKATWLFIDRAMVHRAAGRLDDAIKDTCRAIEATPDDGYAYGYRGYLYRDLGQREKALADFQKARSLGEQIDQEDIDALREVDEKF